MMYILFDRFDFSNDEYLKNSHIIFDTYTKSQKNVQLTHNQNDFMHNVMKHLQKGWDFIKCDKN